MAKRNSRSYYIWCDESDKEGLYYSNFYGGILIRSADLHKVLKLMSDKVDELDITEEIKWQKVNEYTFDRYVLLVDFIFDLLQQDLIKIRVFFRHNQYVPIYLSREQMREEYSKLYYQFIKHAFGFIYSNPNDKPISLHFKLDEMPISQPEKKKFKAFLSMLSTNPEYKDAHIIVKAEDIVEVNSKKELPLQMLDLILGAICFKLNDKNKFKNPETNRRGIRTRKKEALYKHIYFRLSQLRHGFNIGVTTGISEPEDRWQMPYRHWSFIPNNSEIDRTRTKGYQDKEED